jgi:tRNA-splicing ligase RtcB
MEIKTFGPVDERSRKQLLTCMKAGDAEFGVLCADHHPGYSQPIGGAVAYEGCISPSGVGYDIACIAAGSRVTTADTHSLSIEDVGESDRPLCWDTVSVRPASVSFGAIARGTAPVVEIALENGRALVATPDHRIRVKTGWREAGELRPGDRVACVPYIGMPADIRTGYLDVSEPPGVMGRRATPMIEELHRRGLWPLRLEDPRTPALLRLLGHNCGDGHLSRDGKTVSFWMTDPADARSIGADIEAVGFQPREHRRTRPNGSNEIHVKVGSVALRALLAAMGAPVGRKAWPERPMPWLFRAPAWVRAVFLSAFASAEATTPALLEGRIPNLAIKQAGEMPHAAHFVARLLRSVGFRVSDPALSGPPRGQRATWVIQLLGGEAEQLRFLEEVGFCYSRHKREAAAAVASSAWQRLAALRPRVDAWAEARGGHHAWYGDRGVPRSAKGAEFAPDHSGEVAWVAVRQVTPLPPSLVLDVVTGDPAESFLAEGVVVHNCGNKAVLTNARREDLDVPVVMREISRRISFGVGVRARERVHDHPVLDRIASAAFEPQRKLLDLARDQLGTVGSGNHFVNLFADEQDRVWVGVHFGSRGFGHKTATGFLALAQGLPFDEGERKRLGLKVAAGGMDSPPVLLDLASDTGGAYVEAMQLAGEYAYAGRDVVVDKVLEILGAEPMHVVHNHHNFAWLEEHFGRKLWVIRKGCTPAQPGQEGFVGATMGDDSVILEGVEGAESADALYSTVHGAGRVMSRRQAKRSVDWPAVRRRLEREGIVLVGGAADEAPDVYKRLPHVLAAHGDTIRVKHTLRPLGVAMAGRDVFDPYKD